MSEPWSEKFHLFWLADQVGLTSRHPTLLKWMSSSFTM